MARLSFGVCFAPDPPPSRWVDLTKLAEAQGFEYAWLFDSHVLWQEVYPIFTLMAANTRTIKIGPCVTNPGTRDPTVTASALATLNAISGGRMVMGIGRGDSARRVLGQKPVTVEEMEADCRLIRDLAAGREVSYDGVKVRLKWAEHELPIWVAGYGPKALRAAGRVADGVIIQLADPAIIKWCLQFVREGAEEAGRSFDDIQIQAAAPAFISDDLEAARGSRRLRSGRCHRPLLCHRHRGAEPQADRGADRRRCRPVQPLPYGGETRGGHQEIRRGHHSGVQLARRRRHRHGKGTSGADPGAREHAQRGSDPKARGADRGGRGQGCADHLSAGDLLRSLLLR